MRTALVIGTGLIGTSAALALAGRGVQVHLADHDPQQARTAAALGAGTDAEPEGRVDLAIVAVPPAHVAATLAEAMRQGRAHGYVDVASVKGGPRRELESRPAPSALPVAKPLCFRPKCLPVFTTSAGRP